MSATHFTTPQHTFRSMSSVSTRRGPRLYEYRVFTDDEVQTLNSFRAEQTAWTSSCATNTPTSGRSWCAAALLKKLREIWMVRLLKPPGILLAGFPPPGSPPPKCLLSGLPPPKLWPAGLWLTAARLTVLRLAVHCRAMLCCHQLRHRRLQRL